MEKKSNFNKNISAVTALQKFVAYYRNGYNVLDAYEDLLNRINNDKNPQNINDNMERRKIIEKCRDLFKDISMKEKLDAEIAYFEKEMISATGKKPTTSQVAKDLFQTFSEELMGIAKRTYDMSELSSNNMLSLAKRPDGTVQKAVAYASFDEMKQKIQSNYKREIQAPEKILQDKYRNPIHIQFMGCLTYKTRSTNEYIYKFNITKNVNGKEKSYEIFSNIDIFASNMKNSKEYGDIIASELLSDNNLERSNADGYIGEIHPQSALEPGDEKFDGGIYTYQINPKYALVYNGERIEAIRAYKQQEMMKKSAQAQAKSTPQHQEPKSLEKDDGPEI